jgi:hypothetical protein
MKTIGVAVLSLVAAFLRCANAGDFPSGGAVDVTRPIMVDLPSLVPVEANYEIAPFALDRNQRSGEVGYRGRSFPVCATFVSIESEDPMRRLVLDCGRLTGAGAVSPFESEAAQYFKYGSRGSEGVFSFVKVASTVPVESNDPVRLELSEWSLTGASAFSPAESEASLYLKFGPNGSESILSRVKVGAVLSHASAVLPPVVRVIEVVYADASKRAKKKILAQMCTRVGQPYSERGVEVDIRRLYSAANIGNVRIFGEPIAGGVKVIVVLQSKSPVPTTPAPTPPKGQFNFNVGYQF